MGGKPVMVRIDAKQLISDAAAPSEKMAPFHG
ncbi:hypothetical protein PSYAC_20361 [Pseudomonas syringae pv. actinidiae str. M302091]|nr:hypothetical protein PSYAC_20361 [Pseudomonas syringae pv. actinidiae str. M302091]